MLVLVVLCRVCGLWGLGKRDNFNGLEMIVLRLIWWKLGTLANWLTVSLWLMEGQMMRHQMTKKTERGRDSQHTQ